MFEIVSAKCRPFCPAGEIKKNYCCASDILHNAPLGETTTDPECEGTWYLKTEQIKQFYLYREEIYGIQHHYDDVIMSAIASQITSLTIGYSIVYLDADQRKHQSSVSLAFVRGIHREPMNSPHKWPVTRKMFSFDNNDIEA